MNKSAHFWLLSGSIGIFAGIYALIGAFLVQYLIYSYSNTSSSVSFLPIHFFELILLLVVIIILITSIITAYFLTKKMVKKHNKVILKNVLKRLLVNFSTPLLIGGLFCVVLYKYSLIELIAPATLIFYGLACINVSKYNINAIFYLGIANSIVGLIASQFINYGLYFWALGFGIFNIFYGCFIYLKYRK